MGSRVLRKLVAVLTAITVSLGIAVMSFPGHAQAATVQSDAQSSCSVNPMAAATPIGSSSGFSIFTTGDVTMQNSELEGSIAVGGTATFNGGTYDYPIMHASSGSGAYAVPTVDGEQTRALFNNYSLASTRTPYIKKQGGVAGFAKLIHWTSQLFSRFGASGTQYGKNGQGYIKSDVNTWANDTSGVQEHFTLPSTTQFMSSNATNNGIFPIDTGREVLAQSSIWKTPSLTGNANEMQINLDGSGPNRILLHTIRAKFGNSMPRKISIPGYSTNSPLIVKVQQSDIDAVTGRLVLPSYMYAANDTNHGDGINYLLFDLSDITGTVNIVSTGEPLRGSVYAPQANVIMPASNLSYEGQIIAHNFSDLNSGYEIHTNLFKGLLPHACGSTSISLKLSKTVDGKAPTDAEVFSFDIDRVSAAAEGAADFVKKTVHNKGASITFDDVETYTLPGRYVYRITEENAGDAYRENSQVFYAKVSVSGTSSLTATSSWFSDAGLTQPVQSPTFSNTSIAKVGGFDLTKQVIDREALMPTSNQPSFTIDYSYNSKPAGTLTVRAGETVQGPRDIPAGTVVSFAERAPANVEGAVWKLDPIADITISTGDIAQVRVNNELVSALTALPDTGGSGLASWWPIGMCAVLLAACGLGVFIRARAHSMDHASTQAV